MTRLVMTESGLERFRPRTDWKDVVIYSSDGPSKGRANTPIEERLKGRATGRSSRCSLGGGCSGVRVSVVWDDGRRSRPCSEGLRALPDGSYEIQ